MWIVELFRKDKCNAQPLTEDSISKLSTYDMSEEDQKVESNNRIRIWLQDHSRFLQVDQHTRSNVPAAQVEEISEYFGSTKNNSRQEITDDLSLMSRVGTEHNLQASNLHFEQVPNSSEVKISCCRWRNNH